jgi:hypothetical protein
MPTLEARVALDTRHSDDAGGPRGPGATDLPVVAYAPRDTSGAGKSCCALHAIGPTRTRPAHRSGKADVSLGSRDAVPARNAWRACISHRAGRAVGAHWPRHRRALQAARSRISCLPHLPAIPRGTRSASSALYASVSVPPRPALLAGRPRDAAAHAKNTARRKHTPEHSSSAGRGPHRAQKPRCQHSTQQIAATVHGRALDSCTHT